MIIPWLAPMAVSRDPSVLAAAAWQVRRLDRFDARFGVMTAATLLVSPIVWDHYLLIATIPA